MDTSTRLPRILQRFAEFAIVVAVIGTLMVIGVALFADGAFEMPVQFTPDADSYRVTDGAWGDGTILSSAGSIRFDEGDTRSAVIMISVALALALPAIVILVLLRQVLRAVSEGEPFVAANGPRLAWIGVVMVVWSLAAQVATWIAEWMVMDDAAATGVHLEVNIMPDLTVAFLGLVIVALGAVFRHGARLQADADLTV